MGTSTKDNELTETMASSSLIRALDAVRKMKAKIETLERDKTERIAIVGMSCRFPGKSNNPYAFWQMLRQGRDGITEIPDSRWSVDTFFNPDPDVPGKMYSRHGAFIDNVDRMDAHFFGLSPREVAKMDPQHRLLLTTSWEALEDAAIPPLGLSGTRTGVFVGIGKNDYAQLQPCRTPEDYETVQAYDGTGNGFSFSSGRLSYFYGLEGPSMAVDTACSSSLTAIHLACQSLRNHECDMALVGGVHLILAPLSAILLSSMKAIAPDGRSKTFDASADGFGRGEGCAVVILKRRSDAIRDNDPIRAVIRGTAVNQDGRSSGMTVPHGPSQQAVIRQALKNAGISPKQVKYIETHGTGTSLGDPIEIGALGVVFNQERPVGDPLLIGSIKTNIGHLEAAAGMAGLIKVVLALQHEELPAHLHYSVPNPHIAWSKLPISVVKTLTPWPRTDKPRIAGLSSFGLSGTNAHLVIEEAPVTETDNDKDKRQKAPQLFILSARSDNSLKRLCRRYADLLSEHPELPLADVCYTAALGRSHFEHRLGIMATSTEKLCDTLRAAGSTQNKDGLIAHRIRSDAEPTVAFLFSGNPKSWNSIGRHLYQQFAPFRMEFDRCQTKIRPHASMSLHTTLFQDKSSETHAGNNTALFVLESALAKLWISWGVEPSYVSGQGVGELVAAYIAGLISLESGLQLAQAWDKATVGSIESIDAPAFKRLVRQMAFFPPRLTLFSSLCDRFIESGEKAALNWRDLSLIPDNFTRSVDVLQKRGCHIFIPIGIGFDSALEEQWATSLKKEIFLPAFSSYEEGRDTLLRALATLYIHEVPVNWREIYGKGTRRALPTYPFEEERFWIEKRPARPDNFSYGGERHHPYLGKCIRSPLISHVLFESFYNAETMPYLNDHQVFGKLVVPGASHLAMFLEASLAVYGGKVASLKDVVFHQALVIPDQGHVKVQVAILPEHPNGPSCQLISIDADSDHLKDQLTEAQWTVHAQGLIVPKAEIVDVSPHTDLKTIQARCSHTVNGEDYYNQMMRRQFLFGPSFHWIYRIWKGNGEALAHMRPSLDGDPNDGFRLFPGLIDSCLQMIGTLVENDDNETYVAYTLEYFQFCKSPATNQFWCHASIRNDISSGGDQLACDLLLFEPDGSIVADIRGFTVKRANRAVLLQSMQKQSSRWLHEVNWWPAELRTSSAIESKYRSSVGKWLIFDNNEGSASRLTSLLAEKGWSKVVIFAGDDYQHPSAEQYVIRPCVAEDYSRLFADALNSDLSQCLGIIFLWGLSFSSLKEIEQMNGEAMLAAQESGCLAILQLVKAVSSLSKGHVPRLWLLTSRTQSVENDSSAPISPIHAAIWGLGRVVNSEHPELRCSFIDFDSPDDEYCWHMLTRELIADDVENQITYRNRRRFIARLTQSQDVKSTTQISLSEDKFYLISGGFGALGQIVAERLVLRGAKRLILVGRRKAVKAHTRERIDALKQQGVQVIEANADISSSQEMEKIGDILKEQQGKIGGVIHAAGILDDGVLIQQERETFINVLAPKIAGSWNLHCMVRNIPLDFFICFSSAASLLGAPGQGNYAAANAFMDSMAYYRRSKGLPCISINWGPWKDVGMTSHLNQRVRDRWQSIGVDSLSPQEGMDIFEFVLNQNPVQTAVMPVSRSRISDNANFFNAAPFYADILKPTQTASKKQSRFMAQLKATSKENRKELMIRYVRQQIAEVLDLRSPKEVKANQKLFDFGMDSLMAVELRNRLQQDMGQALSATLVFDYPTLSSLSSYLLETVSQAVPVSENKPIDKKDEEMGKLFDQLDMITDDQIFQRIEQ